MRICDKPGCGRVAAVTITVAGRDLDDHYDACALHAQALREQFLRPVPEPGPACKGRALKSARKLTEA